MNSSLEYASFLIRVWREPPTESDATIVWCGEVVHIQSRERRTLDSLAALVAFLRERSGDPNILSAKSRLR